MAAAIQAARDHGAAGYNAARALMGLASAATFADIAADPAMQQRLKTLYGKYCAFDRC
jgi:hypothetical protein